MTDTPKAAGASRIGAAGSPWQASIARVRAAVEASDAAGLAEELVVVRELCVPADLRDALLRCVETLPGRDEVRFYELLDRWSSQQFGEDALGRAADALAGVGPKRAQQLAARGLGRIGDLLFHLPVRYDDRRSLESIGELDVGRHATFVGEVRSNKVTTSATRGRVRRVLEVVVGDATGTLLLKWFRASDRLEETLREGTRLLVTGDVRRYRFSKEIVHPDIELLGHVSSDGEGDASGADDVLAVQRRIVPEYVCPEGIPARSLRKWIEAAVVGYSDLVPAWLPASIVEQESLPGASEALRLAHSPESDARVVPYREFASPAHKRLVLEELYLLELGLALRHGERKRIAGIELDTTRSEGAEQSLPFALTVGQVRALSEIRADLGKSHPMSRLLQGDVGSGKTAVAFLAAIGAITAGRQVAFMAPTELLAEQHLRTLKSLGAALPEPIRPRIALLSASLPKPEADEVRRQLVAGELDLVVGTHALVQPEVRIPKLALAIIDEQHRFGVRQRASLASRGEGDRAPHVLVMTATPIPRTLALTLYGDLDVSIIDTLPPGRSPTQTLLAREGEGKQVAEFVRATLDRGEQAYVVYPLVEESEKSDLRAAVESAQRIARAFSDVRVDIVHGRLDSSERAAAMKRFGTGETRILVSTTVIEVGVDVANATLMVVEHAERFGLAQLHQLRGRVGRGDRPGTCVLVARGGGEGSEARIAAMLETTDGFKIADADMRIRGPGEFLGTRQSGYLPDLRIADLLRDSRWIVSARETAFATVEVDPGLLHAPQLRRAVEQRWGDRLALSEVG